MTQAVAFKTPGVLEDFAYQMFGASIKNKSDAIGQFGTGLKYTIAIVLSSGGSITIWNGLDETTFEVKTEKMRGVDVEVIYANDTRLPFTTNLGQSWEPWMAFRELASNTMDENGEIGLFTDDFFPEQGYTTIIVDWEDMLDAYWDRDSIFIHKDERPLVETNEVNAYRGTTSFLYCLGVRAANLEAAAVYRWSFNNRRMLTEDRVIANTWGAARIIARALVVDADATVLNRCWDQKNSYESEQISYDSTFHNPSETFISVVEARLSRGKFVPPSAVKKLDSVMTFEQRLAKCAPVDLALDEIAEFEMLKDKAERLGLGIGHKEIRIFKSLPDNVNANYSDHAIYLAMPRFDATFAFQALVDIAIAERATKSLPYSVEPRSQSAYDELRDLFIHMNT